MSPEEFTTGRLSFRKFTQNEFTSLFESNSEERIRKELGITSDAAYQKEQEKYKRGSYSTPLTYFQLINKSTSAIIGWCGFHHWYEHHRRAEMGYYMLKDEVKGKGLMSEAIKPILDYGFTQMNLNRIEAFVAPYNEPSLKLMKKFGFVQEGLLRQHYCENSVIDDSVVFSLLKQEYKR